MHIEHNISMRKNNYANDVAVILLLFIIVLLSGCASSNSNALVTPEIAIHYGEEKTKELEMLCEDTTKISVANQLISKAKRNFELKEQNDIQEDYGALLEYKCSNPDVVKSTSKIKLLTTDQSLHTGYIWVEYSVSYYNQKDELLDGSDSIISRWEIEKDNDEWMVVKIDDIR